MIFYPAFASFLVKAGLFYLRDRHAEPVSASHLLVVEVLVLMPVGLAYRLVALCYALIFRRFLTLIVRNYRAIARNDIAGL